MGRLRDGYRRKVFLLMTRSTAIEEGGSDNSTSRCAAQQTDDLVQHRGDRFEDHTGFRRQGAKRRVTRRRQDRYIGSPGTGSTITSHAEVGRKGFPSDGADASM